jgi:hypothetical protein
VYNVANFGAGAVSVVESGFKYQSEEYSRFVRLHLPIFIGILRVGEILT